jgi:hypothetical protein
MLRRLLSYRAQLPELWRQLQLLELLDQLPLSDDLIVCPGCEGGGDKPQRSHACPGDCCQVCGFCMGRRFFRGDELRWVSDPFAGTPPSVTVNYFKTDRGEHATCGYIPQSVAIDEAGLGYVQADARRRFRERSDTNRTHARLHAANDVRHAYDLPLVAEDALLLLRRCGLLGMRDASIVSFAQAVERVFPHRPSEHQVVGRDRRMDTRSQAERSRDKQ